MSEFNGKIAIVTGAAGGIGAEVAARLHGEGATVVMTDLDEAGGKALAEKLGDKAIFRTQDVTSEQGWIDLMAFVSQEYGQLDILANIAGYFKPGVPFQDMTLEIWQRHYAINSDSVFMGCQHGIKMMKARKTGSIVNISTGLVHRMLTDAAAYCASKTSVLAVSHLAALEGAKYGIRVNAILPGAVDTPMMWRNLVPGQTRQELHDFYLKQHPIGRIGNPGDMADSILFLLSDKASFITGAELAVDGGQIL
jgi:NAD(P)-dependent dehydrogenase (short-subunit alcohol dehydrogenase family)